MTPPERLSRPEFIALMAMLFSMIAFSLDAMLPGMPQIAADIAPDDPNRAQFLITSFVFGMGVGTLFTGPLSDSFGRRPILLGGVALYLVGALIALLSDTLETAVLGRIVQGLGAAGPRIVALAIIRDLYAGRQMAKLMSFVMIVFTLVPAFAPTLGAGIMWAFGWRGIFVAFMVWALTAATWVVLRQRETHPPEKRTPFRVRPLWAGIKEILGHRVVGVTVAVQALSFGILFANLAGTQPIFDVTFGQAAHFHLWFGLIAAMSASSSVLNAAIVERLGMRRVVTVILGAQVGFSTLFALAYASGLFGETALFVFFIAWTTGVFFQAGLTVGNLNALAMEPMGHLAGLTASVVGSVATVFAALLAVPLGLAFDGTPVPLAVGTAVLAAVGWGLMQIIRRREPVPAS